MKGVAVCSIEQDHFIRARRLSYLSERALRVKFDNQLSPATLCSKLIQNETRIKKCLNGQERAILYPETGIVSFEKIDFTLMVKVLRNTGLRAPSSGFDCKPNRNEIHDGADVARLKCIRDRFAHTAVNELHREEYEDITQTLIEVIRRFCGSLFDDDIRSIMEYSLDCLAGTFTYHVPAGIALVPNALNKTKESVVQLYEHQPLHYSIYGGIVCYSMQKFFEIPSIEEMIYFLKENMHECSYVSQSIAEVILYQPKQSLKIEGNVTFPVLFSDSISSLDLDLPALNLQYRHDQRTSLLWSRPCVTDLYKNHTRFGEQLYRTKFSKDLPIKYIRPFHQVNITSCSKYVENSFDVTCWMEQESGITFSSNSQEKRSVQQQCIDYRYAKHLEKDVEYIIESMSFSENVDISNYYVDTNCLSTSHQDFNNHDCSAMLINENIARNEPEVEENEAQIARWSFFLCTSILFLLIMIIYFRHRIQSARENFKPRFKDFLCKIWKRPHNIIEP